MSQAQTTDRPDTITEMKEAFCFGKKMTVTPRDGEAVELHIRPFFTEQAFGIIDQLEKVFGLAKEMADTSGNIDLFQLFKVAREEVLVLLAAAIERDRKTFVGRLEIDELIAVFATVFEQNKDFFQERVKSSLETTIGQITSIL